MNNCRVVPNISKRNYEVPPLEKLFFVTYILTTKGADYAFI